MKRLICLAIVAGLFSAPASADEIARMIRDFRGGGQARIVDMERRINSLRSELAALTPKVEAIERRKAAPKATPDIGEVIFFRELEPGVFAMVWRSGAAPEQPPDDFKTVAEKALAAVDESGKSATARLLRGMYLSVASFAVDRESKATLLEQIYTQTVADKAKAWRPWKAAVDSLLKNVDDKQFDDSLRTLAEVLGG